eukprot:TRINITY_DN1414_c2_g2_i1.p2 TRINITY_DN1414_c2_g2~~TRINITY_DN1414_c2_g2_i1.p2  ORF type:complete len:198 (-),score=-25.48 TRINITY_DN1414_c2_g2_i1:288-881(-)
MWRCQKLVLFCLLFKNTKLQSLIKIIQYFCTLQCVMQIFNKTCIRCLCKISGLLIIKFYCDINMIFRQSLFFIISSSRLTIFFFPVLNLCLGIIFQIFLMFLLVGYFLPDTFLLSCLLFLQHIQNLFLYLQIYVQSIRIFSVEFKYASNLERSQLFNTIICLSDCLILKTNTIFQSILKHFNTVQIQKQIMCGVVMT